MKQDTDWRLFYPLKTGTVSPELIMQVHLSHTTVCLSAFLLFNKNICLPNRVKGDSKQTRFKSPAASYNLISHLLETEIQELLSEN